MSCIGAEAITIFNAFEISEDDRGKIAPIKDKFKQYFTLKANTTYKRNTFNKLMQVQGETFDAFPTKIKTQSAIC